jgi:hypothetical protein
MHFSNPGVDSKEALLASRYFRFIADQEQDLNDKNLTIIKRVLVTRRK